MGCTTAQLCEPASLVHASISEEHAAFWLASYNIPNICIELGLLHCVVCWKAVGSGHQHQIGLIKHSWFMAKALLNATICILMDMDHMFQIGLKLHTYFRLKAMKQRRLKVSLYPLPSLESFHMVAYSGACGALLQEHQVRTPRCQSPCPDEETSPQMLHAERTKNTEIHLLLVFLGHGEPGVVLAEQPVISTV